MQPRLLSGEPLIIPKDGEPVVVTTLAIAVGREPLDRRLTSVKSRSYAEASFGPL